MVGAAPVFGCMNVVRTGLRDSASPVGCAMLVPRFGFGDVARVTSLCR